MFSFLLCSDCRQGILPFAVIILLFWLGGVHNPNFYFGFPSWNVTKATPTPYPPSFRIQFDTNISRQDDGVKNGFAEPLRSALYYDWSIPAQRIDHPPGAYECVRFYNVTTRGCQLYFLEKGMYRATQPESKTPESFQSCCLDIPGLGPPPPNWAQKANPTFGGLKHDGYSMYDAWEFVFDNLPPSNGNRWDQQQRTLQFVGTTNVDDVHSSLKTGDVYDEYHTAREVHDGNPLRNGIPLVFTFPSKAKGRQDFHFDPVSLVVGSQDPKFFQLPTGCEEVVCDKSAPAV